MTALIAGLPGGMEWVVLLIVALVLFGGARVAGLGKGAGRAIREFKEEVKGGEIEGAKKNTDPEVSTDEVLEAEIVPEKRKDA